MTYQKTFELPVVPKDVYAALTDPGQLTRWFAEEVDVDLRVGGAYRFWGRHTLWVPSAAEADQCITRIEAERVLEFGWTWKGCASRVELRLAAAPAGTRLEVCHSFEPPSGSIDVAPAAEEQAVGPLRTHRQRAESDDPEREHDLIVDAFWDLAIANLHHYLEKRAPFLLPLLDGTREVELAIVIRATPEYVFQALTETQGLIDWMGAEDPDIELVVGGAYTYGWHITTEGQRAEVGPRRIIELVADQLLVHDWFWPGQPRTEVRWELERVEGGTRLHLRHSGFDAEPESYKFGWPSGLSVLVQQLEGREVPSWLSQER